jgi:protein-tyrosine phosphatase
VGLRKGDDKARRVALMRIVFVCLGNICRSPAAEGVMRGLAPELELDSAGTAGWHAGDAPYGPMQDAASARDLDLRNLRARQFVAADFDRFDLIVAMDAQNQSDIEMLRPKGNVTPVRMLADTDVPDPYYTRDFDGALDMIESAARRLLADISGPPNR